MIYFIAVLFIRCIMGGVSALKLPFLNSFLIVKGVLTPIHLHQFAQPTAQPTAQAT